MWARNLLFIGLVLGGLAALAGRLFPPRVPQRVERLHADALPPPDYRAVVRNIDAEFRSGWERAKLTPAARASDLTVARRLALALTGTIPSLQEIRRIEANPEGDPPAAYADALLHDRGYADYFAERLARAYVGTEDGPFIVYRRRRFVSWLSDQLLGNRPYDALVRDLIAGQGLWTDQPATNFVTVTIEPDKGPDPQRLAARVARAFLGVRLDCAQCHNHPFQPWKQRDFQGLAAYFGQAHQGFTGIYDGTGDFQMENRKTGKPETVEPSVPFHAELLSADGSRRQQLARWVTDPQNPYFARATVNRVWALLLGRPLVEPVDDLGSVPETPRVLQLLADDFTAHGHDLRRLIGVIAATEVFRLDSAVDVDDADAHEAVWAVFPLTRLRPEQMVGGITQAASLTTLNHDSHILLRLIRAAGQRAFVERYGDTGEDDFHNQAGTIPQRLLLMNGELVHDQTKDDSLFHAAARISFLAPTDAKAVETAYLTVLTRRPSAEEAAHFESCLADTKGAERTTRLTDLFWTLLNSTEFASNH